MAQMRESIRCMPIWQLPIFNCEVNFWISLPLSFSLSVDNGASLTFPRNGSPPLSCASLFVFLYTAFIISHARADHRQDPRWSFKSFHHHACEAFFRVIRLLCGTWFSVRPRPTSTVPNRIRRLQFSIYTEIRNIAFFFFSFSSSSSSGFCSSSSTFGYRSRKGRRFSFRSLQVRLWQWESVRVSGQLTAKGNF